MTTQRAVSRFAVNERDARSGTLPSHIFTSEPETEGRLDKIADQISDTVPDGDASGNPGGRGACEALVTTGRSKPRLDVRSA